MKILILYHFFHPDTVISARLFSDLAEDLVAAGHEVTVFTGNHLIRSQEPLPNVVTWKGVNIYRFNRPSVDQGNNFGRLFNSLFLQMKWLRGLFKNRQNYDIVLLGTDPQFGYLMYPWIHRLIPKAHLMHWCFDLYPEAIMVCGNAVMRVMGKLFKPLARWSYSYVNTMIDIGSHMRWLLNGYHHHAKNVTATPWALAEADSVIPADSSIRNKLFGNAKLCFLYSGTVGHAHDLAPFIELARECRRCGLPVGFCFAGYGNCYQDQTAGITAEDTNITLAGFASEEELAGRLAAADFHLISIKQGWEGIVVPSKFFGALAMGRPVLYSGPEKSGITEWIGQLSLGYVLQTDFLDTIRYLLEHPEHVQQLKESALLAYQERFSRKTVVQTFLDLIEDIRLQREQPSQP